ncbi:hypothetical protein QWY93_17695 [Echinicola jeungdonensis]|uniref:Deoxynucleoside kinase domain-containing protein n=1 Tax=Echinicola jeungdonensis TaxID=709343 RepID=A0ABV5J099_9BACT|nr:hypothetical protein [Echinicola jeungdonensis]MDN3671150.1 hypothetical protein [Echinicola jeungdonensis]
MEKLNLENIKAEKTQTIEFIGAPGVGKSTLYKKLRGIKPPLQKWTYIDAVLKPAPPFFKFLDWSNYQLRKLLKKKHHQSVNSIKGIKYIQKHKELAQFIWEHLSDSSFPANQILGQRYRSAFYLFRDFSRYQTISEVSQSTYCIIDEGLLQRSYLLNNDPVKVNALLEEYLSLVPLPQAVFYVYIDSTPLILQRLKGRHKTLIGHIGLNNDDLFEDIQRWQMLMKLIVENIKRQGVKVFPINGENPVAENLKRILEILNKEL